MSNNTTLTATGMLPAIGQLVVVHCESLSVVCKVMDVKYTYGKPRVQVQPVAGVGTQWVELGRIRALAGLPDGVRRRMEELLALGLELEAGE